MIEQWILKIKRGETPLYRTLRRLITGAMRARLPLPKFSYPLFRLLYHFHYFVLFSGRWLINFFYREPLFRSRCASVGRNLHLTLMVDITGHPQIHIGNNVNLFGHLGITSGRVFDEPKLIIHDRVDIGHNVQILVNKEVVIEEEVNIASFCRFMDSDAHPRDPEQRAKKLPPNPDDIKPIRICKRAWIGQNSFILKGVTVGEGAVVGVNSVVVSDVPPYSVAMGNPARVVFRLPKPDSAEPAASQQLGENASA
ncbi:MAG: acyltransferase [Bryobacterales bacterium]|nr:acyltransferase [Bryobacterales bacterium]